MGAPQGIRGENEIPAFDHRLLCHNGSMGVGTAMMASSSLYFRLTKDRKSRVWVFDDETPSRFLPHSFSAGTDEFRIQIIDLFGGRQPLLVSYESIQGEVQIPFRPTVILDSNVVSYLHQYVTGHHALPAERRSAVHKFLRFVVARRLDYNAFFYYIEASSRNDMSSLPKYAEDFSESILRLHTMDTSHFLSTGKIRTDPALLDLYRQELGCDNFSEMVKAHTRQMIRPLDFELEWRSKLAYATLLKTALIHRASNKHIIKKYGELTAFMEETLNIALGFERMLALGYFAGMFDGFIPVQRGAAPDRALKRVRAAAWDLLLLDLPSLMIVQEASDGVVVGFVCSSDKALSAVANACRVEAVMAWAPKPHAAIPVMTYDFSYLESVVGTSVSGRLREMDSTWQGARRSRDLESETHISFEKLEQLVKELESEVVFFCAN